MPVLQNTNPPKQTGRNTVKKSTDHRRDHLKQPADGAIRKKPFVEQ